MTDNDFLRRIKAVRRRVDELRQRAVESREQLEGALPTAFEEFLAMLDELRQQNEELAAACRAAKEECRRYYELFEFAPDGIVLVDGQGRIVDVNRQTESMFGYSRRELLGKPIEILVPERFRERHGEHCSTYYARPHLRPMSVNLDLYARRRDGSEFPANIMLSPLQTENGLLVASVVRDMTGHKRVQETLRRRAEEMAVLHAVSLDIIKPHDLPTLLQTVVERAARLLDAPAGGLYLCDPERKEVRCVVSHNTPRDYTGIVLRYGEGAAGTVAQTGEPLVLDDYHAWPGRAAVCEEEPLSAMLSVPLIWQDWVTGVIFLLDDGETRRFTQADSELLTLFANQAAIAVENARLLETEREQREVAQTLREVAGVLNTSLDLEKVLRQILEQLARVIDYDSASVMLLSGDVLDLVAYRSFRFERREEFTPLRIDALKHVQEMLENRVPVIIPDTTVDSRWLRLSDNEYTHCWLGVPLVVQDRVIGLLNLGKRQPDFYSQGDARLAVAFAHQAAIAIENARLFEQVRAGRERLQALSRRLLDVQENERRHIARELHDEVNQVLTGLKLTLETVRSSLPDVTRVKLGKAAEFVNELMAWTRELSLDLRPTVLDDAGLLPALLWHFKRYSTQTGVEVHFEHSGLGRRFPPEVETAAYRIVQEALTNVARHADVGEVTVRLLADEEMLGIQVIDQGVGFDPKTALATGGSLGLVGMQERAMLLGGQLTVQSAPGTGTRLTAELPVGDGIEQGGSGEEDHHRAG